MHHFTFSQTLPITLQQAWLFFSDPNNLKEITPPEMNFVIIRPLPKVVYEGMFIEYKVTPLAGISMEWVTEITHVKEPSFFIDEQRTGPYAIWHHEHHFEEVEGGVKMTDLLYYRIPFGILGKLVNTLFIKKKVLAIFKFRNKKLSFLFPEHLI